MSKRKAEPGECCQMTALVISRQNPRDQAGLAVVHTCDGKTWRDQLVIHFRRAPRGDKSEFANTTVAYCNFCPFCGAKQ